MPYTYASQFRSMAIEQVPSGKRVAEFAAALELLLSAHAMTMAQMASLDIASVDNGHASLIAAGAASAPIPEAMKAMYETAPHRDAPLAFVCAATACARPSASADALAKTIRNFGVNRASSGNLAIR